MDWLVGVCRGFELVGLANSVSAEGIRDEAVSLRNTSQASQRTMSQTSCSRRATKAWSSVPTSVPARCLENAAVCVAAVQQPFGKTGRMRGRPSELTSGQLADFGGINLGG